jgi:hypothetical protein
MEKQEFLQRLIPTPPTNFPTKLTKKADPKTKGERIFARLFLHFAPVDEIYTSFSCGNILCGKK